MIKSVDFALDQVVFDTNVSCSDSYRKQDFFNSEFSDSDNKQDSFDSESSDTRGEDLKILPSNQMLSRLPITLAQLEAENHSEKLKNEIR